MKRYCFTVYMRKLRNRDSVTYSGSHSIGTCLCLSTKCFSLMVCHLQPGKPHGGDSHTLHVSGLWEITSVSSDSCVFEFAFKNGARIKIWKWANCWLRFCISFNFSQSASASLPLRHSLTTGKISTAIFLCDFRIYVVLMVGLLDSVKKSFLGVWAPP